MAGWNVLVVGNGSREHALIWKLSQSDRIGHLYCAPGNGGTGLLAENVAIPANRIDAIADWSASNQIDLVVVGPEEPLALGLVDRLSALGILAFGPSAAAAKIEASKVWAKQLMSEAGVPTASYVAFEDAAAAWAYAQSQSYPLVLKADGLAAGKGVVIAQTADEARVAIQAALEGRAFGDAGRTILIEDHLIGNELSLLAFVDGRHVVPLVPARDHKRVGDGDTGPNTGGMGAFAPSRLGGPNVTQRLTREILEPIAAALADRGVIYRGIIYAGLMLTADGPRVIEFNCRFGDPETQVILPLLGDDLAELAYATATGQLGTRAASILPGYRCGVVLTSGGYPGPYSKGHVIQGLDEVDADALVFHAGTRQFEHEVVTDGGRVLTVVGQGDTLNAARSHAYANAARIRFEGVHYRRDIGLKEVRE